MSKVVEIVVQAVDKASKTFDEVSKQSKKLESALKSVKKYSWIAMTALAGVWTLAVKQAVQLEPVKKAFNQLAESAGDNADKMLKSLKEASKWSVAEYDLMLSANRAMKLWVAENTEDMTTLMKVARLYGQQMGQDVQSSFNDIVTWLWRWSAQILDNLWIVINATEAQEEYAKQIWKTAKELTDAEKKQALINATLEEWKKALEEFGEPQQTMAERLQALKNQFQEMATRVGEALIPVLEKVLEKITPIIEKVSNWIAENPELASKILLIWTAVAGVTFALSNILPVLLPILTALGWPWVWMIGALSLVRAGLNLLEEKIISTDEQLAIYNQEVETLNELYNAWLISEEEYRAKMQELEWQIQATKDKANTFWQYLKNELNNTLQAITSPIRTIKDLWNERKTVLPQIQEKFVALTEKIQWFIDKVKRAIDAIKDFVRESASSGLWSWIVSAWISIWKSIMGRAVWWPVSANTPYIVWEEWPELFVPNTSWNIVPNDQMWNITVNVNFGGVAVNNWSDEVALAETITETITRNLELYKKGIY